MVGCFFLANKQVCVCYTSDLQTSPIFTVDYYKGVAKSAAEAGAHMIGIKVSVYFWKSDCRCLQAGQTSQLQYVLL